MHTDEIVSYEPDSDYAPAPQAPAPVAPAQEPVAAPADEVVEFVPAVESDDEPEVVDADDAPENATAQAIAEQAPAVEPLAWYVTLGETRYKVHKPEGLKIIELMKLAARIERKMNAVQQDIVMMVREHEALNSVTLTEEGVRTHPHQKRLAEALGITAEQIREAGGEYLHVDSPTEDEVEGQITARLMELGADEVWSTIALLTIPDAIITERAKRGNLREFLRVQGIELATRVTSAEEIGALIGYVFDFLNRGLTTEANPPVPQA